MPNVVLARNVGFANISARLGMGPFSEGVIVEFFATSTTARAGAYGRRRYSTTDSDSFYARIT